MIGFFNHCFTLDIVDMLLLSIIPVTLFTLDIGVLLLLSIIPVTLFTENPDQSLRGFFIQAIQADINIRDLARRSFGKFENLTSSEQVSKCQDTNGVPSGGITHTNGDNKQSVRVVWIAPETYSPGPIQIV